MVGTARPECPLHRICMLAAVLVASLWATQVHAQESPAPAVVVYGATPAGIAASLAAAADGAPVLLVDPNNRIGGMVTNGLSHTDFRTFEGLTGTFLQFVGRVADHYRQTYGETSAQARSSFRGTQGEPGVNLRVFESMLAERPSVQIQRGWALATVKREAAGERSRISAVVFTDRSGRSHEIAARMFVDATYEGDLMAASGAPYRVGREARSTYGESLAPEHADAQVQGYNFRLTMTRNPANRVAPRMPDGYDRSLFAGLLPLLEDGRLIGIFGYAPPKFIYKAQIPSLPNDKFDINDVSHAPVRLSLPDINDSWPDADAETRQRLFREHLLWNVGLLYFLQNDPAVPRTFQEEARSWGWARDEFVENGNLPEQLYVREGRRLLGHHVFTERDTDYTPGDARSVLHRDAIAMGDYGPNSHGTAHEGPRFGGRHTGEFYKPVAPYQIPYGVLVPPNIANLLVPVAASASHVGFSALRLEPIWAALGQAAGHAARLAIREDLAVQDVPVRRLQATLHEDGAATIYVSDVPPADPDFARVQWWASAGGLHGLYAAPEQPGARGTQIEGQYFEAYPGHAAELDRPLDAATRQRWELVALELGMPQADLPDAQRLLTRREWLGLVWAARPGPLRPAAN